MAQLLVELRLNEARYRLNYKDGFPRNDLN